MSMRHFKHLVGSLLVAAGCLASGMVAAQAAQPAPATAVAPEYRLGAGDVIRVSVYQNQDLTLEARLSDAGVISYPLLGTLRLGGLSVPQAEKRIADGLRDGNFVKQPQVSILVLTVRGNQVSVLGNVNRPGRYPIESGEMRLTDMIATAGGVAQNAADTVIVVGTRDGKPYRLEVDLGTTFATDRRENDILMQNGDAIWVDRAPQIYIYGEVQRPGAVRLERGMTVMQALASGGGLSLRGTEKGMRVHRRGADGKVQVVQPAMDDQLRDGDVVYVRESLF